MDSIENRTFTAGEAARAGIKVMPMPPNLPGEESVPFYLHR
jgi:hypothetical protein